MVLDAIYLFMSNITELYKRDNADFSEKLEMREFLAQETVEKENLFSILSRILIS